MTVAAHDAPHTPAVTTPRTRVAVQHTIEGDLRYLSHHNQMRLLERALARAAWPLAFSQGFNPRPRLSLPLPRNVGVSSDCEIALIDLSEPRPARHLFAALAPVLPPGCRLVRVAHAPPGLRPHARRVVFETQIDAAEQPGLAERIAALLSAEALPIERQLGPRRGRRRVDIRPFIEQIESCPPRLRLVLSVDGQGTARPTEVLAALRLDPQHYAHRLHRVQVEWDTEPFAPQDGASIGESSLGQEDTQDQS